MTEIQALRYAIRHLEESLVANPALRVVGQAPKAIKRLENMLKREVGMKMVADAIQKVQR